MGKTIFLLLLAVLICGCSSSKVDSKDPTTWTHFKIYARAYDDSLFQKIQYTLDIQPPLESFIIIVNTSNIDIKKHIICIGDDEYSHDAFIRPWSSITEEEQNGLLNWKGKNKINLEK